MQFRFGGFVNGWCCCFWVTTLAILPLQRTYTPPWIRSFKVWRRWEQPAQTSASPFRKKVEWLAFQASVNALSTYLCTVLCLCHCRCCEGGGGTDVGWMQYGKRRDVIWCEVSSTGWALSLPLPLLWRAVTMLMIYYLFLSLNSPSLPPYSLSVPCLCIDGYQPSQHILIQCEAHKLQFFLQHSKSSISFCPRGQQVPTLQCRSSEQS